MEKNLFAIIFISLSLLSLIYGTRGIKRTLNLWLFALLLNASLITFPYLGMDGMRVPGIRFPIGYIPFIALFLLLALYSRGKFYGKLPLIRFSIYGIWLYGIVSLFWVKDFLSWFQYFSMWVLYSSFFLFSSYSLGKHLKIQDLLKFLRRFLAALSIVCIIGLFKFFILGFGDANPWPLINRNGTIFTLVPLIPLIFALRDIGFIKQRFFWISIILFFLLVGLIFSRMGLIGSIFSVGGYLFYKSKQKILTLFKILLFLVLILGITFIISQGKIAYSLQRLSRTYNSGTTILKGEELSPETGDWRRFVLFKEGLRIFKEHWLLGTGMGLDNYRFYFNQNIPTTPAKPHCFYLSYMAEFGILGFSFLLLFLGYLTLIFNRAVKKTINSKFNYIAKAIFVGHLSILIMLLFNEYITSPFTWFYWALGLALVFHFGKKRNNLK